MIFHMFHFLIFPLFTYSNLNCKSFNYFKQKSSATILKGNVFFSFWPFDSSTWYMDIAVQHLTGHMFTLNVKWFDIHRCEIESNCLWALKYAMHNCRWHFLLLYFHSLRSSKIKTYTHSVKYFLSLVSACNYCSFINIVDILTNFLLSF